MTANEKANYDQLVSQLQQVFQQHHGWIDADAWLKASHHIAGAYFPLDEFNPDAFVEAFREALNK